MSNLSDLDRKSTGKLGEQVAINFLESQGYSIKETNYKLGHGEIDIIAFDKDYICFIEVKTQKENESTHPLYAITDSKQRQLSKLALLYIKKFHLQNKDARFDVVGVMFKSDGTHHLNLIKNAFSLHPKYT